MTPNETQAIAAIAERLRTSKMGETWRMWANELRAGPANSANYDDSILIATFVSHPNESGRGSHVAPLYLVQEAIELLPTLLQAIADRDATIESLTRERDEANEVNSKWIWRIGDAVGCDGSWSECLNAIIALRKERDEAAAEAARREREKHRRFHADLLSQVNYLAGDKSCPCGAREDSIETHPHVTGCAIGKLRKDLADAIAAGEGGDGA